MNITYRDNPLETTIELDDHEKQILWHKVMIEELSDLLFEAHYYLTREGHVDIERAQHVTDPKQYMPDEGRSEIEKSADETLEMYIDSLRGAHVGDCTCVPCSCSKCQAEALLDIDSIEGLGKHEAHKIDSAFSAGLSLDEVIDHLKDYVPYAEWDGWEKNAERWKQEASRAYDWMVKYKGERLAYG